MYSVGDELTTPVMYQDLAQSSMGYMMPPMMYGAGFCGGYYPSLAGVNIQQQPSKDSFVRAQQKEKEDCSALKTALVVLGGIIGLGFLRFKGHKKSPIITNIQNSSQMKAVKNFFAKIKNAFVNPKTP